MSEKSLCIKRLAFACPGEIKAETAAACDVCESAPVTTISMDTSNDEVFCEEIESDGPVM
jgi:hypothetical protein